MFSLMWLAKIHPIPVINSSMIDLKTLDTFGNLSWKNTSFSKTMLLQRELFLTMFYTINSSPLLVTKYSFM